MAENTKTCATCERTLSLESFSPRSADGTKRHADCKLCRNKAARISTKARSPYGPTEAHSYFRDNIFKDSSPAAAERLAQHAESRDVAVGSGTDGFAAATPGYLVDEYVKYARSKRPLLDVIPPIPMPPQGHTFNLPVLTGGASVAAQATENAAVSNTDITSSQTQEVANQVTYAGEANVSRVSFERSASGLDTIIYADLRAALDEQLDAAVINGDGTNQTHLGLRNVSGVYSVVNNNATPTAASVMQSILQCASKIGQGRFSYPTHVVLAPRRYAWLMADTTVASLTEREADGFAKLVYVVDSGVGLTYGASTNADEIYVVNAPDFRFAESDQQLLAENPKSGTLTVKLTLYSYSMFIHRYAKSIGVVSGTSLVQPSGF